MNNKVIWLSYPFDVCAQRGLWNEVGGIYIFTGLNQQLNEWTPQYIGQTDNFHNRIPSHEFWILAVRMGATHVHAMTVEQEGARLAIERELIQAFQPLLNTQHRPNPLDLLFPGLGLGR